MKSTIKPVEWLLVIVLLAVAAVTVYIRIRLMNMPLVRDEGGFAYAGQLILQGVQPFAGYYDNKMPGVYYLYALFMLVMGQKIFAIRAGLLIVNLLSAFFVFYIGKKLHDKAAGLITAAFFLAGSVSFGVEGVIAYTEHFAVFFLLLSLAFAVKYVEKNRILYLAVSGVFSGLAFICKQPAVFAALFVVFYFVYAGFKDRKKAAADAAVFIAFSILPIFALAVHYAAGGTFGNFWRFTVGDAVSYSQNTTPAAAAGFFLLYLKNIAVFFSPYAAVTAAIAVFLISAKRNLKVFIFPAVFFILSFISVCAGRFFYPHYFIFLIPASSMLAGIAVSVLFKTVKEQNSRLAVFLLFFSVIVPAFIFFYLEKELFFEETQEKVCKSIYDENPFVESVKIAEYISQNTVEKDRILVLGSEPQICFYSRRKSPTGYLFMNQMAMSGNKTPRMQEQALDEIEKNPPKYVVFVYVRHSWGTDKMLSLPVVRWFAGVRLNRFEKTGVIDLLSPNQTNYVFGDAAKKYKILSGHFIEIYKSKE